MKVIRHAESILLITGCALVALCVLAYTVGFVRSRVALRDFNTQVARVEASNDAPGGAGLEARYVDVKLWSDKRIHDYNASLRTHSGSPLAVLEIDRLRIEAPVFEGTDDLTLNRGVGRIAGTAHIGDRGNVGIAGHRDGFFRALKDVAVHDTMKLRTLDATNTYTVDSVEIVSPEDVSVLRDRDVPSITLVTCYPFYFIGSAPKRFIVHASLQQRDSTEDGRPAQISSTGTNANNQEKSK